jgi:PAS domain S-box-containing protein
MNTERFPLAGITELDAAVQRLLTIRSEHEHAGSPLLKQALSEIDQVIEELQVMFEELSQGRDDVQRLSAAVAQERRRRVELMEALSVACVFTDAEGILHEANTSALLLLGGSVEGLGRDSVCDHGVDRDLCEALLARASAEGTVSDTLVVRRHSGDTIPVTASVSKLRNLTPPLWRWFLQRA